ncbi:hypothetical protein ACTQ46_01425 [Gallicola sp. Sow4_E12]|uniref:hypothetical protein n=1 Tax=Gallicola sp. Sow4_E12 TaxID=3438785 RepID=UPI003F916D91
MGIVLGMLFSGLLVIGFSKWNKKDFDGYNHLAAMILFILMVQWFLLTSAANT